MSKSSSSSDGCGCFIFIAIVVIGVLLLGKINVLIEKMDTRYEETIQ